ncbi:MAG: ABC transporter permease subunit [Clostridiaceae bacterium]
MAVVETTRGLKYRMGTGKHKKSFTLILMTVPLFLFAMVFNYGPIWGWLMAFVNYTPGVSIFSSEFTGLKQFSYFFEAGSLFLPVLRNTLVLNLLALCMCPVPIIFALMLTESRSVLFKKAIQTVTSFPNFISWIIVYSVFFAFLSVEDGMINHLLLGLNIIKQPTDILADAGVAWFLQTFASIWKGMGWNAIIYLAAIAGIDKELYDAAEVDGAGRFKRILHITIPGLMPTFSVILILSVGNLINSGFDQFYVFDNALVHDKLNVIDTYTYRMGLQQFDFSYATAVGIFKSLVSIVLLFTSNLISKAATGRSIV